MQGYSRGTTERGNGDKSGRDRSDGYPTVESKLLVGHLIVGTAPILPALLFAWFLSSPFPSRTRLLPSPCHLGSFPACGDRTPPCIPLLRWHPNILVLAIPSLHGDCTSTRWARLQRSSVHCPPDRQTDTRTNLTNQPGC